MTAFSYGKIYKLISDNTDKIYIGSTCSSLTLRLIKHKHNYNCFLKGKGSSVSSYPLLSLGNVKILLLEKFPCETKKQLNARERYFIEQHRDICLNKTILTRTPKEYVEDHRDAITKYQKKYNADYYQKNKIEMQKKMLIYNNKNKISKKEYDKLYNTLNKDKIREKKKQYYLSKKTENQIVVDL